MSGVSDGRIRILFIALFVCALILLAKLYMVQVLRGDMYAAEADRQYTQPQGGMFNRGKIFFQDRESERIAGATIASGFLVSVNPGLIDTPSALYETLAPYLSISRERFIDRMTLGGTYREVAHQLTQEQADEIMSFNIDGVRVHPERWRVYPGDMLAAHTLGFVGYSGTELAGLYGLERYYERVLRRDQPNLYVNFFAEIFSNIEDVAGSVRGEGEGDLVTTIEPVVQATLEDTLATIESKWSTRSVGGIIMDPSTGEIRAFASRPTFDPNNFSDVDSVAVFTNPLVENVYEMGSIVKPLTVAAGLDAGVITPTTTYNDTGSIAVDGYTIYNFDKKGRGIVDMYTVLGNSLNTGVSFIVKKLGNERFSRYMESYGLGTETGIDLPGEVSGLVSNLYSPRDVEHFTASFGQGIAVTPIEMTRALAVLANGGLLVTPHIGERIEYPTGLSKELVHAPPTRVLKESTSDAITKMLVNVVDEYLAGGDVALESHSIAAKTGTAQIANPAGGGYYADRYLHSFFGYFPAYDPKFIVFLYAEEPQGVNYASETLTTPFMDLTRFLISYYNLPPDR